MTDWDDANPKSPADFSAGSNHEARLLENEDFALTRSLNLRRLSWGQPRVSPCLRFSFSCFCHQNSLRRNFAARTRCVGSGATHIVQTQSTSPYNWQLRWQSLIRAVAFKPMQPSKQRSESLNGAEQWIQALQLHPHPEGGWYGEVYRAGETIPYQSLPGRFSGERHFSTAIYFLLNETDFSALHRIKQDELWHFYDGSSLTIHMIDPTGNYSAIKLGRNIQAGEALVVIVKAGWLFGATVNDARSYGLVGCTVAPGFDFDDFEMPSRTQLLEQYPQHRDIIENLTRQP